ncbi:DUF4760 domain-containing protein [Spirulina sp. 06S082]|uniref:DUF4760 domain-containing protein n=1 Tax=Spirulina sp. 06S082 TaxID=3110248 RepID=UPI002B22081E|nr:DUF4760 domain-containing protein [Spirulina sp. 06S082]MEA5470637.1 DUF4760 domain-containing protein [Spirulina sp. 06S082]
MKNNKNNFGSFFLTKFLFVSVPLFLLLLGLVGFVSTKNPGNRNKRIEIYTEFSRISSLFNSIILTSSLFATVFGLKQAYNKYKTDIEANRKQLAFDHLNNIVLGKFLEIRNQLEDLGVNPYKEKANYLYDRKKTKGNRVLIRDVLNTLNLICIGINCGVIDEEIARKQMKLIMVRYWKWANSYVLLARMIEAHSTEANEYDKSLLYIDYETQIHEWLLQDNKISTKDMKEWRQEWKQIEMEIQVEKYNNMEKQKGSLEQLVQSIAAKYLEKE